MKLNQTENKRIEVRKDREIQKKKGEIIKMMKKMPEMLLDLLNITSTCEMKHIQNPIHLIISKSKFFFFEI